jgi:hypothetical protein
MRGGGGGGLFFTGRKIKSYVSYERWIENGK